MRADLTGRFAALTTRVDRQETRIDEIHERQIRADERQKVRRETGADSLADGTLGVQRWQLYVAGGIGTLGVIASLLNVALSHHF